MWGETKHTHFRCCTLMCSIEHSFRLPAQSAYIAWIWVSSCLGTRQLCAILNTALHPQCLRGSNELFSGLIIEYPMARQQTGFSPKTFLSTVGPGRALVFFEKGQRI